MQAFCWQFMEAEMTEMPGAGKSERTEGRAGYRSGYCNRGACDAGGNAGAAGAADAGRAFSTSVFESYQRSEKALAASMVAMYVNGVSTRKVSRITEELCGRVFLAGTISNMAKGLDEELKAFAERGLEEEYPYLILEARCAKARENRVAGTRAAPTALGVSRDGRCEVLAAELANRESGVSWKDF